MPRLIRPVLLALVSAFALAACAELRPAPEPVAEPVMRWDHRPEAAIWTRASMEMLNSDAAILTRVVPSDAEDWCPGYTHADAETRAAFWTGFMSALARYESTWNPDAVGAAGAGSGCCRSRPRRRGIAIAPWEPAARCATGRPTCAAPCGSWR